MALPGRISLIAICPVDLDQWNLDGKRLPRQMRYVMKLEDASCSANSFRIRHSSLGPSIVLIMYCKDGQNELKKQIQNTYASEHILWARLRDHIV